MGDLTTYTYKTDKVEVSVIIELEHPFRNVYEMFPEISDEMLSKNRGLLRQSCLLPDDTFILRYQSYVVKTPQHTILVDTGLGANKSRERPEWNMLGEARFLGALNDLGVKLEDVDHVIFTHLHTDHVGWNTRLIDGKWVPTFPNARYHFNRDEYDYTQTRARSEGYPSFDDSVFPIVEAGLADFVSYDHKFDDRIQYIPTPGHSKSHAAILIDTGEHDVVLTGDIFHVPLQMIYPALSYTKDFDVKQSADSRRAFLTRFSDTPTLCFSSHFPGISAGFIKRVGQSDNYGILTAAF